MAQLFEESDYYTGPPLDSGLILRAEENLGVRLPRSYVEVLLLRNGGTPRRRCFPTSFKTSWADDYFEISGILGIGGTWGIDATSGVGSAHLIAEWGYPEIGVVICDMPSAGCDAVMLDYSSCGPQGEPFVAYIDEDRIPRRVAQTFGKFIERLVFCDSNGQR